MSIKLIISFILALPKIWAMIKDMAALVEKNKANKTEEAIEKLKRAKTEEEIKDATRDLARNP